MKMYMLVTKPKFSGLNTIEFHFAYGKDSLNNLLNDGYRAIEGMPIVEIEEEEAKKISEDLDKMDRIWICVCDPRSYGKED